MTPYPNYHFKEHKCFLYCHNNNYYCFRQNFRTILHWHWHAFSWPLAPASNEWNDGKIITFLPSTCEWSRHRRLHVVGRLLVIITSIWLSCEAALSQIILEVNIVPFKVASHDSQMLVTATYSHQMTEVISSTSSFDQLNWRRRMLHFCRRKQSAQVSLDTVS